jgi:hypothetical protein
MLLEEVAISNKVGEVKQFSSTLQFKLEAALGELAIPSRKRRTTLKRWESIGNSRGNV